MPLIKKKTKKTNWHAVHYTWNSELRVASNSVNILIIEILNRCCLAGTWSVIGIDIWKDRQKYKDLEKKRKREKERKRDYDKDRKRKRDTPQAMIDTNELRLMKTRNNESY